MRLPPGEIKYPYHAHQVQWEFYLVIRGHGIVRRNDRTFGVEAGDAFVQPPGTAHQIRNASATKDWIYCVIADNPVSDPVDRTLVATASLHACALATSYSAIRAFYLQTIW